MVSCQISSFKWIYTLDNTLQPFCRNSVVCSVWTPNIVSGKFRYFLAIFVGSLSVVIVDSVTMYSVVSMCLTRKIFCLYF